MTTAPKNKEYFYNIDVLRIVFVLFIVYYHFIRANYVAVYNLDIFTRLAHNARYIGEVCNSALFMISGYFLCSTMIRNDESFFHFAARRLMRFWPVLFFGVCCTGILSLCGKMHFDVGSNLLNILCLTRVGSGVVTKFANLTPSWFVCALFWGALFYCALFRICNNMYKYNFIVSIISYFGMVIYINSNAHDYDVVLGLFPKGGCLALSCIGMGILIYSLIEKIKESNFKLNGIVATILEAGLLFYLISGFIYRFKEELTVMILAFMILLILFLLKRGAISNILNKKIYSYVGRYAFSVYIMQTISFVLLKNTLWQQKEFVAAHPVGAIWINLLCSFILGVVTYHIVEDPCAKFIKKKLTAAVVCAVCAGCCLGTFA